MGKSLKLAGFYTSVILGAGFASGRELVSFFGVFGVYGIYSMIVSGVLFAVLGYVTLKLTLENGVKSYGEFLGLMFGRRVSFCIESLVIFYMLVVYGAMLSAFGVAVHNSIDIDSNVAIIFLSIVVFFMLIKGADFIITVSSLMSPVLIIGSIVVSLCSLYYSQAVFANDIYNAVPNAFTYTSYNMLTAVVILIGTTNVVTSKKIALTGSVLAGVFITMLGVTMLVPIISNIDAVVGIELPMQFIIGTYSEGLSNAYFVILIMAIFTTATANGLGVANYIVDKNVDYVIASGFVVVLGYVISKLGFMYIVSYVYPMFAIIGIVQICFMLSLAMRRKK